MSSLIDIGKKYPTSKNISGFIELYDFFLKDFKDKKINILEIGVDNGDSLRVWSEYFTQASICGIDIVKKDFTIPRVNILCGDQTDPKFLNSIIKEYKKFDIIIDDGSHISKDIIFTFKHFPRLLFEIISVNISTIFECLKL